MFSRIEWNDGRLGRPIRGEDGDALDEGHVLSNLRLKCRVECLSTFVVDEYFVIDPN